MEIINLKITDLKPYKKNAKKHPKKQIKFIANSIEQFGMNDPIGVYGKDNIIVEGHGRALQQLNEIMRKEDIEIHIDSVI